MKSRTKNRGEQKERNREPVRTQLPWTIKLPHTTRRDHTVSLFFLELFPLYGNYVLLSVSSSPYSLGSPPSGSILDSAPFVTLSMLGLLKPFCLLSLLFPVCMVLLLCFFFFFPFGSDNGSSLLRTRTQLDLSLSGLPWRFLLEYSRGLACPHSL